MVEPTAGLPVLVATDDSRRVSVLFGVLFGLAGMGSSSAALAVPLISEDLGVSPGTATWTISLYVLMLAVCTAVYGRLSDLYGVRTPLLAGVALMTLGAVVAALAPTFEVLLGARLLQGAGAAAVPTLGVAVLSARYAGEVRGLALGRLAGTAAALSCLGPLAGGAVETFLGWRAVMALPVLGILVVPIVWAALGREGSRASLDLVGAVLVALTAGGVVLVLQSPSTGVLVAVVGVVLMALGTPATAVRVRRRPHGFLPLSVIGNGTVVRCAVAAAAVPAAWFAMLVAAPGVLIGDGWEPWRVGLVLVPSAVVAFFVPRLTAPMLARLGPVRVLGVAGVGSTVALGVAAAGAATHSAWLLGLAVVGVTVAFGLGQPSLGAAVGDAVADDVRGVALGVATLLFLVGGSIGSAVVGGVGEALGVGPSLGLLALLPVGGLVVLSRDLRRPPASPARPAPLSA